MKYFSFFCLCALFFSSCESSSSYEYPALADEHMTFTIDGQEIKLSSVVNSNFRDNTLSVTDYQSNRNQLQLVRTSTDGSTSMKIDGQDLPITILDGKTKFADIGYAPVTITVTSSQMSGSIYCPHEEDGSSMQYSGLFRFDSYNAGMMTGSFMTDPASEDNVVEIKNGTFAIAVTQR